ncbi:MAG TPA: hypothetical protein VGV93_03700 [Acidimicrobiales bacterium]|nr:hypothetical protein [Acidimicrobiales bacterium]
MAYFDEAMSTLQRRGLMSPPADGVVNVMADHLEALPLAAHPVTRLSLT